jgi:methyl-CpG-binding domain protein 4
LDREILIQEDYYNEPWKMLICCILLNQTSNKQVRPILKGLFRLIPDPQSASICDPKEISEIIKSTGFQNLKSERIIKLSKKWIDGFDEVGDLPGIGKYGKDSWEIFINKNFNVNPTDKKLISYLTSIPL